MESGVRRSTLNPAGSTGFTLIELMLAVAIMAIIMMVVYSVVVSTIEAQEEVEGVTLGTEIGPVVLNLIRQDLEAAFLPDDKKDWFAGLDRQGSGGARDRVDFVAGVMSYKAESAQAEPKFNSVNEISYTAEENRKRPGELILYRREDAFIDDDPAKGGHLTEIYDRVASFGLQYWDGEEWRVTWSSKSAENKLPRAVKVEMVLLVPDKNGEGGVSRKTYAITVAPPR